MKNVLDLIRFRMYRAATIEVWNLFCRKVAWRLPRRLVMWAYIRVVASATSGGPDGVYNDTVVPDLTAMDAIQRWEI